ncbi:MAG: hypothetical protein R3Y32_08460 [Bacillota bacterium]
MKNYFNNPNADEMERALDTKSKMIAYHFVYIALCLWGLWESASYFLDGKEMNIIPILLVAVTLSVQGVSKMIMKYKATKDDEEREGNHPIMKTIFKIIVFVFAVMIVSSFLTMFLVRM